MAHPAHRHDRTPLGPRPARRRARTAAAALAVAAALVLTVGPSRVDAAPSAIAAGSITRVEIAAPTSGPFERVRIDIGFAIPDGASAGDQFHLTLPPQLMAVGPGFEVKDPSGAPIATATTSGNVVTFTTTAYVDAHDHVTGSAFLESVWDRTRVVEGATVDLAFDADGTAFGDRVVLSGGLPDRSLPDAWQGWADERAEDSTGPLNALRWTVSTPQTGASTGAVAVVVTPGAGSTISCDQVTVRTSARLNAFHEFVDRTVVPDGQRTVVCGPGQLTVFVTDVPAATWVLVGGRASVTDASLGEYTNTATITANGTTVTARGVATHSAAGGNGAGAARSTPTTARPSTSGATRSAGRAAASGDASTATSEPVAETGDAATPEIALGTGQAAATPPTGSIEPTLASSAASVPAASRSNGFQSRSVLFLGAVLLVVGVLWFRRSRA